MRTLITRLPLISCLLSLPAYLQGAAINMSDNPTVSASETSRFTDPDTVIMCDDPCRKKAKKTTARTDGDSDDEYMEDPTSIAENESVDRVLLASADSTQVDASVPLLSPTSKKTLRNRVPLTSIIPGSTVSTPTAFGADWGDVYAGVGVENRARYNILPNATGLIGFGAGDSLRYLGLDTSVTSYGVSRHGPPFKTGGIGLKVHRYFPAYRLAAALGAENAVGWGESDSGRSVYGVVSQLLMLEENDTLFFSTLIWHLGIGNGRFRPESALASGTQTVRPFGGVSLRVVRPASFNLDWTGSNLAAGISVSPFKKIPLLLAFNVMDFTGSAGDGARFVFSIAYGDNPSNAALPLHRLIYGKPPELEPEETQADELAGPPNRYVVCQRESEQRQLVLNEDSEGCHYIYRMHGQSRYVSLRKTRKTSCSTKFNLMTAKLNNLAFTCEEKPAENTVMGPMPAPEPE